MSRTVEILFQRILASSRRRLCVLHASDEGSYVAITVCDSRNLSAGSWCSGASLRCSRLLAGTSARTHPKGVEGFLQTILPCQDDRGAPVLLMYIESLRTRLQNVQHRWVLRVEKTEYLCNPVLACFWRSRKKVRVSRLMTFCQGSCHCMVNYL
jgi:hypothetical protein